MLVGTVRRPGAKGTRKLVEHYGDRLICVRYRHDPAQGRRDKTAEPIVEESRWRPSPVSASVPPSCVPVRIGLYEKDLQRKINAAGGTWQAAEYVWHAPEFEVRKLGLVGRIVRENEGTRGAGYETSVLNIGSWYYR